MKSAAQRRLLHAKEPAVAKKFESETPKGKKLPEKAHPAFRQAVDSFKKYNGGGGKRKK